MTRYQLSIYAEKLPRRFFRRPNPYATVTISGGAQEGTEIGRTETLKRTVDPDWVKVLFLETDSSIYMPLKVTIWNDMGPHAEDITIVEATFEATEIFDAPGRLQVEQLPGGTKIYAGVEESIRGSTNGNVKLHLRGLDIRNIEAGPLGLGRSDPFFVVSKKNADHVAGVVRWNTVYRSEQIYNHLNPFWDPFTIGMEELCYSDINWPLKITVYDYQDNGKHRIIGQFETSLKVMKERVAIRGNADRVLAFEIFKEGSPDTNGLIVVLAADLFLES